MKYFTYMGQSSLNITDEPTIIASLQKVDDWTQGSRRKTMAGERTYYRPIANEFGTVYSDILTIKLGLVKCHSNFTYEEQIAIETWLTSPLLSRWLYVYDTDDPTYCVKYFGKVISTDWAHYNNGFLAVDFTFETNAPYPWTQCIHYFRFKDGVPQTKINGEWVDNEPAKSQIDMNEYEPFTFNVDSDELESPVYPLITFYPQDEGIRTTFGFNNLREMHGFGDAQLRNGMVTKFDCRYLILSDEAGLVDYDDWDWGDVGNVYWPRFWPGKNQFMITGDIQNMDITIAYNAPYKKVGGWI